MRAQHGDVSLDGNGTNGAVGKQPRPKTTIRRVPRLSDVADAAHVAPSTASRVLNGDPGVSVRPETSARILAAARKVGYRPNAMARGLRASRTGSIAMVLPLIRNPIWTRLQAGAVRRAEEHGYVVMMLDESADEPRHPDTYRYLVDESRVDGLVLATARRGRSTHRLDASVPHVYVNRFGLRPGTSVVMDEDRAVRLVVELAVESGHRSIAMLDGPRDVDTVYRRVAAARRLGAEHGIAVRVIHADPGEQGGADAAESLLTGRRRPTLCAIGSLNQVFGLVSRLRALGVAIPGDMSVVSFDEDECLAYLDVGITAVAMPLDTLGAAAVETLLERIAGIKVGDVVVRDPITLVRRASVGPPGQH